MAQVWLNGALLAADQARIDPEDRGFLLGDGAFETLRVASGDVRRWSRHKARLEAALQALEIAPPDWDDVKEAALAVCRAQGLETAVVRLTLSRGAQGGGMATRDSASPTVLVTARALPERPAALTARLVTEARRDARNLSSRHKLTGYADMLGARRAAQRAGADVALVLTSDGHVSSADSANLFWVRDGVVFTPALSCGCLPGTTRAALIDALRAREVEVVEGAFEPSELNGADWLFLTNAVMGLVPLSSLDGQYVTAPAADLALLKAICEQAD
ncbi:aminotransferase class IV [Oceanicaulis sp. LC35]|uniref:aminotransferase class IV n=1 Tax=Oceanicaulis sp. LC35 TaxID=3349635 RepID=UPI003F86DCF0